MSVSICYKPAGHYTTGFRNGTSDQLSRLEKIFPDKTIRKADVGILRAIATATGHEFWHEVADKVEDIGDINFWGEW